MTDQELRHLWQQEAIRLSLLAADLVKQLADADDRYQRLLALLGLKPSPVGKSEPQS